jgi:hypothetical protein
LGQYTDHASGSQPYRWLHSASADAAGQFKKRLETLQSAMVQRNAQRSKLLSYPYLLPSNIPNSISI